MTGMLELCQVADRQIIHARHLTTDTSPCFSLDLSWKQYDSLKCDVWCKNSAADCHPVNIGLEKFWRTTTDKLKKEDEEAKSDETRRIFVENALRASAFQNSFHVFTLICYGLLSGLSLAYILFAFVLTFEEFYVLSGWWSMVLLRGSFYFGSILVAVCCLDRFVIGDTLLETVRNIVHFQIHCIGILLSMLTFLATVVICMYENWLTVDADLQRTELNASTTMTSKNHLISVIIDPFLAWQWLVLFRSVTVAVGWILFATTPNFNYLRQQIEDLIRNYINLYGTDTNA